MSKKYVPPHLRSSRRQSPPKNRPKLKRFKVVVFPKMLHGGKYIFVRNSKTGDLTLPSGGCGFGENLKNCAKKELAEETKNSVPVKNLVQVFHFTNNNRSNYPTNNRRNITMNYTGYLLKVNKNFKNIEQNFKNFKLPKNANNKKRKAYSETNAIFQENLNTTKPKWKQAVKYINRFKKNYIGT